MYDVRDYGFVVVVVLVTGLLTVSIVIGFAITLVADRFRRARPPRRR